MTPRGPNVYKTINTVYSITAVSIFLYDFVTFGPSDIILDTNRLVLISKDSTVID